MAKRGGRNKKHTTCCRSTDRQTACGCNSATGSSSIFREGPFPGHRVHREMGKGGLRVLLPYVLVDPWDEHLFRGLDVGRSYRVRVHREELINGGPKCQNAAGLIRAREHSPNNWGRKRGRLCLRQVSAHLGKMRSCANPPSRTLRVWLVETPLQVVGKIVGLADLAGAGKGSHSVT